MQYTQDYDEFYPLGILETPSGTQIKQTQPGTPGQKYLTSHPQKGGAPSNYITWMDMTFPYTKSVQIYTCPSQKNEGNPGYNMNTAFSNRCNNSSTPCNSSTAVSFGGPAAALGALSLAGIVRPAEVEIIMDQDDEVYVGGIRPFTVWSRARDPQKVLPLVLSANSVPHLEGGNAVYADGHAKWRNRGFLLNINPTQSTSNSSTACVFGSDGKPNAATKDLPNCHFAFNPYY